jgi:tripartite-type tricarboxylate transporter receptor subunit TctC
MSEVYARLWRPGERAPRVNRMRLLAFVLALAGGAAAAQDFPARPVRMVLGAPPGSTIDTVSRALAERMALDLRQPVLVENRPGAGGTIASQAVARAAPDGYTLFVGGCSADSIVYWFVMNDRPPLDPFKDFTPVGRLMRDHWMIVASPVLGVNSLAELAALGKKKPGALSFPSIGIGSGQHLQSERFRLRAGFEATHVPYKDSPLPDLMAGRLAFMVQPAAAVAAHIKSGKLKGLAVLTPERLAALPEVPTSAEAGYPDLLYSAGICLYAPGGTPRDVVQRLNDALNKASQTQVVRQRFAELAIEPVQGSPEEAARFVAELMAHVDELRLAVFGKAR